MPSTHQPLASLPPMLLSNLPPSLHPCSTAPVWSCSCSYWTVTMVCLQSSLFSHPISLSYTCWSHLSKAQSDHVTHLLKFQQLPRISFKLLDMAGKAHTQFCSFTSRVLFNSVLCSENIICSPCVLDYFRPCFSFAQNARFT